MAPDKRIAWVDFARVAAIACIVGFHVGYEFTLDNDLRPIGFIGASLFFIISGFMLAKNDPNLVSFDLGWLGKRYLRIASLYYPTLVALVLLFGSQISEGGLKDIVLHFLFLNGLWQDTTYSIISPAWFVIPLVALYILYPLLNLLVKRFTWFIAAAALLSLLARYYYGGLVSTSPLFFLAEFCFGMALAHGRRDAWMLAPLALAAYAPMMAAPFMLFFLFSLLPPSEPAFLTAAFSFIGMHTFEIFLFHESVMKAALGKWSVYGLDAAGSTLALLAALALVMAASNIIYGALAPGKGKTKKR